MTRHVMISRTASAKQPSSARFGSVENFLIILSLLPSAAECGVQIHQRLQMQILNLDQFILSAEQGVFGVVHGQDVHDPGRHLRLRELKRTPRFGYRVLLAYLLFM